MYSNLHIVVALTENRVIGTETNELPWHIPEDLKHFKKLTQNQTIIMGRKTLESFPNGPLPNRKHIVLSNQEKPVHYGDSVIFVNEQQLFAFLEASDPHIDLFVIGGGKIYELLYAYCNKKYITLVHMDIKDGVKFPYSVEEIVNKHEHKTLYRSEIKRHNGIAYEFFELERISSTCALRWANKSVISFFKSGTSSRS